MKLHILSDLHNEFLRRGGVPAAHPWGGEIAHTDADVIVLAGDIDTGVQGVEWMIEEADRLHKPIVYVLGNHEFYRHEYFTLKKKISALCHNTPVRLLDCGCFASHGVRILGATLWTDYLGDSRVPRDMAMVYAERDLLDHTVISYRQSLLADDVDHAFKPRHALTLHHKELHWLQAQLSVPYAGSTVVVTHHAPHPLCRHPGFPNSLLGPAFCSDLDGLLRAADIDVWVYGHTHANFDQRLHGTRVVCNQAGYPGEGVVGFDAGFVVEV